ncbi:MAG: YtxH domain-containing protein [Acidobacteriota bacterium]|nr:YtxH domain-containing protein [Acidobacteriota bacterium]
MTRQLVRVRDDEDDSDVGTRLAYFVIGGTVGAIVALLFAPKSGRELRGDLADVTRKGVDRTRETAGQLGTKAGEYYEVGRERAGELYASAADKAGDLAGAAREAAARRGEHLSAAIEAGKRAYVEEKRRTESGAMEPSPTYYENEPK